MVNEKGELKAFTVVILFIVSIVVLSISNMVSADDTVFSGTENTVVITMSDTDLASLQNAEMDDTTAYTAALVINGTAFEGVSISIASMEDMMGDGAPQGGPQGGPGGDGNMGEPPAGGPGGNGEAPQGGPQGEPPAGGMGGEQGERPLSYLIDLGEANYNGLSSFVLGAQMEMPKGMEAPADAPERPETAEATVTLNGEDLGSYTITEK